MYELLFFLMLLLPWTAARLEEDIVLRAERKRSVRLRHVRRT